MSEYFSKPRRKFSTIIISTIEDVALPVLKEQTLNKANEMATELRDRIEDQSLKLAPLSPITIAKKGHEDILIDTRQYIDAIQVEETEFGATVGVSDTIHKSGKSQIAMTELADYLEHGTSKMPARPHWRPVMEKYIKEKAITKEKYTRAMQKAVNEALEMHDEDRD